MKTSRLFIPIFSLLVVTLLQVQASQNDNPVGSWAWFNKNIVIIKPDSTVWQDGKEKASWKWIDESTREFCIVWPTNRKDTLKLSASGDEVSGVNADGEPVSAVRVPAK
jgi:hypothetical protein